MFGIASETKMEKIRQVATKIKNILLANDESLAVNVRSTAIDYLWSKADDNDNENMKMRFTGGTRKE